MDASGFTPARTKTVLLFWAHHDPSVARFGVDAKTKQRQGRTFKTSLAHIHIQQPSSLEGGGRHSCALYTQLYPPLSPTYVYTPAI